MLQLSNFKEQEESVLKCKICNSDKIDINYDGYIRNGATNIKTTSHVKIYKCRSCSVLWHEEPKQDLDEYYVSEEYRKGLENTSDINDFYKLHDFESYDKFSYVGTELCRGKVVADIGCGGGAFLDYLSGVAKKTIAIEPSKTYRDEMSKKGYITYAFLNDAISDYKNKVDVVISFDVIEHVADPQSFILEIYSLLKVGGKAIIGTPTEAPIMRELMGKIYEENLLFSTQHLWIFNKPNLRIMADNAGFSKCQVRYKQRYGLGNTLAWMQFNKPKGHYKYNFITETMDEVWKKECEVQELSDYIIIYLEK